jgi:predicted XRE-type DNA-binding protein
LRQTYRHDPAKLELATSGLTQLVKELAHAITAYEHAQVGELPPVIGTRNPRTGELELPRVLRLLRQAAQLDQAELAERVGTHQANVSRWEKPGCDSYSVRQLQRIAAALGCDLEVSFLRHHKRRGRRAVDQPAGRRRRNGEGST